MLRALLWDLDGTLAETERDGHRVAFNRAFEALGLTWRWDEAHYDALLRIAGGRERLLSDMGARGDAPALAAGREALAAELHRRKNGFYAALVAEGQLQLRPGVAELIDEAATRGVVQALATTTSRSNAQALLAQQLGPAWRRVFSVSVCGEDVAQKKPHPEVYQQALARLRLPPLAAVALEDSPGGVAAAVAASVPVVVTRSACFARDTVEGAIAIGPGLHQREGWAPPACAYATTGITLDDLAQWHARMELVSRYD